MARFDGMVRCGMRSILKLMWANIRRGKGSFKGIIILMMLMTFSFSGTVSNNDSLREAREQKFADAGVSDLMVNIYDDILTDEMLSSATEHPAVSSVTVNEALFFSSAVQINGEDNNMWLSLRADDVDTNVFTEDGNSFREDASLSDGEIYLPYKLRLAEGFEVGNELSLRTHSGYDEKFIIKGYYEDILTGATTMGWNYCVITPHDFDRIKSEKADKLGGESVCVLKVDWLHINAKDGISCTELRKQLSRDTDLISSANNAMTRDYFTDSIEMYSRVGTRSVGIFVVLLTIVMLITMYNSLAASIDLDRTELGILKAEGFTAGQISLVYILQYVTALTLGGIAGILVSVPACRYLIGAWKNITGIMTDTGVSFLKCGGLCAAMTAVSTVFILIATSKISRISPVRAISGNISDAHFDSRLDLPIHARPLSFFLALRQLGSRKKSYIGTVLIVTMLVYFVVSIMILAGGLDTDNLFYTIGGEIELTDMGGLNMSETDDIEAEIQKTDKNAFIEYSCRHNMLLDGESVMVHAYRAAQEVFKPEEGRAPKYDNEIMITRNVSEQLGKKIGDTITVKYKDSETDLIITGYFQTVWDFGYLSVMTTDGIKRSGLDEIYEAYIRLGDPSKREEVTDMLNEKYKGRLEASAFENSAYAEAYSKIVNTLMHSLTAAMYSVLLIFAVVIVNMVCKRAFIRERTDIGIYKAMGFTAGALRTQFAVRFTIIAVIGAALGCIISVFFSRKMITYILHVVGLTDFTSANRPLTFILPAIAISACFFAAAYISSRKVKTVEVSELISE